MENTFTLEIKNMYGVNTDERKKKLISAVTLCEIAVNSDEFETFFKEAKFTQLTTEQKHFTREYLFAMVLKKAVFNYYVERRSWWKRFSSVLGWEDSLGVHTYADTFDGMSTAELAAHLCHEAFHSLGFEHSFKWVADRDNSVPYLAGNWVQAFVIKYQAKK